MPKTCVVCYFISNDHDLGVVRFVSYGYDLWCMSLCILWL